MRELIRTILKEYINEGFERSTLPAEERYQIVADKVIKHMKDEGITNIPSYSNLANYKIEIEPNKTYKPYKNVLQKYLREGEFTANVVPLIQSIHPEFTYTLESGKKHKLDDEVSVYSDGEKIVYNTFKMNGEKLLYEPKEYWFEYELDGEKKIKKPDFYWPKNEEIIEVAGLADETFNKQYDQKMMAAANKMESMGKKFTVLDYYTHRKDLQGFYKYVCEKFGFPYDPMDFWKATIVKGLNKEDLKREAIELVKKGTSKGYGERWRQNKIIVQLLGYKGAWDFKKETGAGLRRSDEGLRKQAQQAWCLSSGGDQATYVKFKSLFPDTPFSKTTLYQFKEHNPEEFSKENREEICSQYMN